MEASEQPKLKIAFSQQMVTICCFSEVKMVLEIIKLCIFARNCHDLEFLEIKMESAIVERLNLATTVNCRFFFLLRGRLTYSWVGLLCLICFYVTLFNMFLAFSIMTRHSGQIHAYLQHATNYLKDLMLIWNSTT